MIRACRPCRGTGGVIRRLRHPWADDGEEHIVLCWPCRGVGYVKQTRDGWIPARGFRAVHLERD